MTQPMQPQPHRIRFGGREIEFDLQFRPRRDLSITVHPNLRVMVTAPQGRSEEEVLGRVRKRAGWIFRQLIQFEQYHPLPAEKQYVSGETHRYLGRQYRLKIAAGDEDGVRLTGPFIVVAARDREDRPAVRQLVDGWFHDRARVVLPKHVGKCLAMAKSLELDRPKIEIRKLAKRWGSCTKARTIILNSELIHVPPYCIEYVILHELCHLKVHDHSPRFFQLLARCLPDWQRRKARLDGFQM